MSISEETRLMNFVLSSYKMNYNVKRVLIDYSISLDASITSTPDMLFFIQNETILSSYLLFEFKQRSKLYEDDQKKIVEQYNKYRILNQTHLNASIIPIIQSAKFYVNYIFHDTPNDIIKTISDIANFNEVTGVLKYSTKGENKRRMELSKTTSDLINSEYIEILLKHSSNSVYWKTIFIPFTHLYNSFQSCHKGGKNTECKTQTA